MNSRKSAPPTGSVRLIAGHWRGTRVPVPALPGLRPTSDRVRETLFNWLMPVLPGARVLDVFAGSGALGLEAASRGAARVVMIEREALAVAALRQVLARLEGAHRVQVVQGDAVAWLASSADTFDVAFVDPPFAAGLWEAALAALAPRLAPGALVHVESPTALPPAVPAGWSLHREGGTRDVRFALYRVPGAGA